MNVLMFFLPLCFAAESGGWGDGALFAFSLIAIVPFAERLGFVTEQLAMHTNETRKSVAPRLWAPAHPFVPTRIVL